jgi:hypothetical protein
LTACLRADLDLSAPNWAHSETNRWWVNAFFLTLRHNEDRVTAGQITEEWARQQAIEGYRLLLPAMAF